MTDKKRTFPEVSPEMHKEHSEERIWQQFERIVNSPVFEATKAQIAFLRFVVDKTLNGQSDDIKGYTVATEVFGRGEDFNQAIDPVVSIHANKLRRALERYYLLAGENDPIRIDIPKGSYVPIFTHQHVEKTETSPVEETGIDSTWPCVLILPLKNLTGDPSKDYLGIGFSAELAVEVARYQEIKVLYPIEDQVLPRLKCRFVLAGSVYDTGTGIKITVHLTDKKTGEHIWGDTHSSPKEAAEILAFREQVVFIIASKIAGEKGIIPRTVALDSRRKPPAKLSTYEAILRFYEYDHTFSPESFSHALESLSHAARTEPDCGQVWTMLALLYANIYSLDYPGFEAPLEKAVEYAERGANMCPENQRALGTLALVRFFSNELSSALMLTDRAIALNPNSLFIMDGIGYVMTLCGDWERGTRLIKKVMELNPLYRPVTHYPLWLDCLRRRDFEGAYVETMGVKRSAIFWYPLAKSAALGHLGRIDEAKKFYKKLLDIRPDFPSKCRVLIGRYVKFDNLVECIMDGLRKAGMNAVQ